MLCQSRDSNPRHTPKRAGLQKVAAEKVFAVIILKLAALGGFEPPTTSLTWNEWIAVWILVRIDFSLSALPLSYSANKLVPRV